MTDKSVSSRASEEERLDEETELLMWEYRIASRSAATVQAQNALRSRIRTLIEEARREGESDGARQVRRMIQLSEEMNNAR
jgi:archaellum component FlaC